MKTKCLVFMGGLSDGAYCKLHVIRMDERMHSCLLHLPVIHADETPLQVLNEI